ncbi:hypothetical protein PRZ48_006839 [Zasmidium cellare]|uniref:Uncharacterized protein n=1 Tax=Zasmidium cellare TaxID=395010 RepID=A0ABR0EIK6_ZASCE|nr:hypothetical protein PRZ48_006839 [Zasmidium cellare]
MSQTSNTSSTPSLDILRPPSPIAQGSATNAETAAFLEELHRHLFAILNRHHWTHPDLAKYIHSSLTAYMEYTAEPYVTLREAFIERHKTLVAQNPDYRYECMDICATVDEGLRSAEVWYMSQAIVSREGVVYCSGQLHMDATGKLISGTVREKTRQCLSNLKAVLENAGSNMDLVMKINVGLSPSILESKWRYANWHGQIFLQDMGDFAEVNEEYKLWWPGEHKPARSCVAVKTLPRGGSVEIECIAQVSDEYLPSKL